MKIEMVKISDVKEAKFNPALRTSEKALKYLLEQIGESGEMTPLEIGTDGILGDGHRRLACARILEWEKVPTLKSKTRTSYQMFLANDGRVTKSTKGAEWLQAVNQGYPLEHVPPSAKNYISYLYDILDQDDINAMATLGKSPSIVQVVRKVVAHIGASENAEKRRILLWIYRHGIQFATRKAIEDGCPPEVVIEAIEEDRPIQIIYE